MSATRMQRLALAGGPSAALLVAALMRAAEWSWPAAVAAAVTILCAVWWVSEAIPIPATSLLPLALFPLCGALTAKEVADSYGNSVILLLLGGFILSTAMARNGAHHRLALGMVHLFGGHSSRRVVLGFMAASAMLSMWISNTATTLMLLPVALATIAGARDQRLATPLLLGICYASSVGGMGTPIGTPPNLIFMKVYTEHTGAEISFVAWMRWGLPVVLLFVPAIGLWLTRGLAGRQAIDIPPVGAWQPAERRVLWVFGLTALAWITRTAPFGGWSAWLALPGASDASVALIAVVVMFLVPDGAGRRLLDWDTANAIPWGMLLLFGGGIAIAKAFDSTGLGAALAGHLAGLAGLPVFLLLLVICLAVTFLTELTSNTATTSLLMPILAATATAIAVDPALLMVPAAMSASCAFMLPVATAPNAIVFGSGLVSIKEMARTGFAINLFGAALISALCYLLVA